MAVYFKHTHTVTQNIPYHFVCEHCLKDSEMLAAEFQAEATRSLMTKRPLTDEEKAQLNHEASENLKKTIQDAVQNAGSEEFSEKFKDICPHCKKPQSWALKGMKHLPGSYALIGAFLAALLCLGINFFGFASFSFGTGVIATLTVAFAGFLFGFIRVQMKKSKTKTIQQKQLPLILWPNDEQ